jgi:hypothetical protein
MIYVTLRTASAIQGNTFVWSARKRKDYACLFLAIKYNIIPNLGKGCRKRMWCHHVLLNLCLQHHGIKQIHFACIL